MFNKLKFKISFFYKNFQTYLLVFSIGLESKINWYDKALKKYFLQKIGRITAQTYNNCLMYWKFEGLIEKTFDNPIDHSA